MCRLPSVGCRTHGRCVRYLLSVPICWYVGGTAPMPAFVRYAIEQTSHALPPRQNDVARIAPSEAPGVPNTSAQVPAAATTELVTLGSRSTSDAQTPPPIRRLLVLLHKAKNHGLTLPGLTPSSAPIWSHCSCVVT